MTIYIIHAVELCESDTGHDTYYKSFIYKVFKSKALAEKYADQEGGIVTKVRV